MAEAFTFFWKHRLNQWHRAPFVLGGVTFTHAEQYIMHAKALLFGDREAAARILAAETPREQQAVGREVREFGQSVCSSRVSGRARELLHRDTADIPRVVDEFLPLGVPRIQPRLDLELTPIVEIFS